MPDLPARRDFRPLADRAETQVEDSRVFCSGAVEGRTARSAEGLRPFRAAVGCFHVDAGAPAQQAEIGGLGWHAGPVRRPGEALAIKAMADVSHFRVNLSRVNNGAAMASPVELSTPILPVRRAGRARALPRTVWRLCLFAHLARPSPAGLTRGSMFMGRRVNPRIKSGDGDDVDHSVALCPCAGRIAAAPRGRFSWSRFSAPAACYAPDKFEISALLPSC